MNADDSNPYRSPTAHDPPTPPLPEEGKPSLSRVVFGLVALCVGLLIAMSSLGNAAGFVVMAALGRKSGFNPAWLIGILVMSGIAVWMIRLGWRELNGRPARNRRQS